MSIPQEIIRDGWTLDCPYCKEKILYTHFVNWVVPTPFFYSNGSNDVLLRRSDEQRVLQLFEKKKPTVLELEKVWNAILATATLAPNGGRFTFWANVKCPHCNTEIPYNNGVKDLDVRIYDSKIVIIDGAVVVGDTAEDTWRVKIRIVE
jgi:hypothetical protein